MDNEKVLNISLTVAEVNYVLGSLAQRPFVEVSTLIAKIKEQGDTQCSTPQPTVTENVN